MKLSDSKIIQKLAKLLSVVKRSDKFYDNFEKDSNKLAGKYGIDFSQDAFDAMYDDAVYQIEAISAEKLSKDPILSDLSTV